MIHELTFIQTINSYAHSKIQTHHLYIMLKHFIDMKNHQSINFNRLNNMNRDVNAKILPSQVHVEFLKIDLRKEVL